MAKSWEEIKKEREEKIRSFSNPVQNNANKLRSEGFLVANPNPQQRKWEDIRKERGYVEPEPPPIDYWKEQPLRVLGKNINAGINMLPRGMVGVADATIGSLGIEPVNKFLDSYKDYYKKADEELAMLNKGHEFAGGVAQGIGQAIPTMALALMNPAAAVGSVVPTTAKGTQLVANAASLANPTTLNAARAVLSSLKSNPTLYSSMVTSVGNQYLQGLNEGASREEAIKSAIIGGVPSALIEVSGGIENLANILANKTKGLVGVALQAAIEEGFEEIMQYPIENIGQKVAYDKDMPLFSMKEQAVINPKEMMFSGAVGAAVGGLMGGGAAGVNAALYKNYSKQLDAMYKNTINNLPEDSPILERVRQLQDDNVNIDDNTKLWVINSAREGGMEFESETDKLLQKDRQNATFSSNENKVQDQLVEQEKNIVKTQNIASQAVSPVLSMFNIQNIENAREVKQNVYEFYKNSIISDSNTSKPILNKSSGMNVEVSRATINQTFQADDKYAQNQDNEIKIAAMGNLVDLIQNGEFTVVDNSDTPSSKIKYAEIKGTVNFNDTPYEITMDIRRTDNGRKLFVHSLSTNYQQVSGKKSGVIYNGVDERVRQQYPKVYDILDRIGKATNTKFKFVDTIYDPTGQIPGFANGQYDPTTDSIEIALDTFNPFMVVAKHEITHMLEKENPKLYREYKDYVLSAMKENGTYDVQYERMAELYKSRGLEVDKNAIEDELVADATELFLTDEKAINDLVAENKTLGQKILDILRRFIEKIEDILEVSGFTEGWLNTEQLREAERLWVNALSSVAEKKVIVPNEQTNIKNSLKDKIAKNINHVADITRIISVNYELDLKEGDMYDNRGKAESWADRNLNTRKFIPANKGIEYLFTADNVPVHKVDYKNKKETEALGATGSESEGEVLVPSNAKFRITYVSSEYDYKEMGYYVVKLEFLGFDGDVKYSLKDDELIFYRGTVPGETKRIDEPFTAAKGKTFVARKEKNALYYGKRIEKIKAKPGAKIIYENTKEFNKLIGKMKPNQSYIEFVNNAVVKAEKLGYDIISFERDSDIGTVILNEDAVIRNYEEQEYSLKDADVNEIESMILTNHNEYKNNKEALKLAAEAIKDLQKVKFSISSTGRKVDWNRAGIRTIADGISREFINKGYVELKGRKVNSLEELAVIGQIFRDPRFETFRIFYTKNNKIVAHEAISSRIPGFTSAFLNVPKRSEYINEHEYQTARNDFIKTRYDDMKDRMKRLKADGYYLLHNHPSGNPKASEADVYSTKDFMDNVEGFKGHVIINSNKYGWLEMGEYSYSIHVEDMAQQQIELFLKPTIEHPLLNVSITGVDKAASIAKSLQLSKDKTAIVYTDVKGLIRGIEEIPNGMFNDGISIRGFLRNRGRHFGSGRAFLSTTSQDIFGKSANLVKEKYLTDSILLTGSYDYYSHRADTGIEQDDDYEWAGIRSDELKSARVNEENEVFYTPQGVEIIKNPTNKQIEQLRADFRKEFPELAKQGEPPTRRTYDIDGNVYYWKSTDGLHYNIEHYIDKKYNTRTEQNKNFDIKYDDKKFSLKAPMEETKDLIAIHNISEEKLKGILELGGFPVPSIAIAKAEQGHDNFGEISVVFTKDTIDPQADRRNRVFGSDVYSKRFPYVNYKVDSIKLNDIKEKIYGLPKEYIDTFGISLDEDNVADNLQRHNGNFVEGYINEPILKLLFLKEINRPFKPVMKDKTYGNWDIDLLEKIKNHLGAEEAAIPFRSLEYTMKLEPDIRQIVNEFYQSTITKKDLLDRMLYKEPIGFGVMDDLLQQVSRYTREGAKKEIDYYKTKEKLEKVTPKKSFRDWLTKLSEGIIEKKGVRNDKDLYTPSGRMRSFEQLNDEYTLDNIIKLMRGDVRGEEGFMYGLGNVRAGMAKEFKSIEDIKQHKDKIVSPEEFREIKEKANQEYYNLSNQFSKYHGYMIGSSDAFNIAMFETAKKGRIVPSVFKAELKEDGYKVNDIPDSMIKKALDFLNSLKDMPTEYFEAKPQRGVGFDEVAAMVVPKTTDKELLQQLKGKNIKVIKYDEKIEGDRLKKVNSVKGVKFSLKDSQGRTLTQEQAEYFKDSKVRDGVNYLKSAIKNFDFIVKTSDKSKLLERTKNGSIIHINKVDDDGTVIYSTSWGPARTKVSEFIEKINNGEIVEVGLKRGLTKDEILEKIRAEREKALKTFNPESIEPKKVSISESATYRGQDMEWTETYIGKTVLKAGEKAYHTSYRDISSFYPKETCFYESYKLNVIGGDKNIYCLIPKKDIIVSEYSGDGEIRVDLERYKNDVDIYYIGYGESFSVKDDFDRVVGKFTLHHLAPEESYSTNNRIKYQLRDNKSAKDVEKLQNTVTRLKEQFKLTKGVKLDEKAVRRLAKAILKDYSSKYSSSELEVKLYNVYMGMVNGTMEYDEAQSIITEVARDIIENASVLNDAMYKQYSELRNTMRNTAISIDDRYKGDFDAVGGWNDFRKRNFGRMNITNDGMSIDKLYQELSNSYPELFLKDVANPADQLMLISDVLDNLVPIYENPYNRDLNEAVEYLALEIFDGMTSVPEAKPTFADRKKAEKQKAVKAERDKSKARVEALKNKNAEDIAWLKYQNKEKLAEVLQKEKAKRDEAVAKVKKQYQDKAYKTWWRNKLNENDIKSHYQEMIKELRINRDEKLEQQKTKYKERISGIYEDRKIRQAKDRIRTMAKKLDKMLRSPTQKQHIPKALDKTIAELLTMLDFTTDRQKETTQIKLRDLRAEYEKIAKVSDEEGLSATADPYIVEALEMLHGKRIVDMNLQEIELLRDIVGYFENMVRTYNKAFLGDKWIDVSTKAEGIIKDLETDTPMNESAYGGILYFKDMMNWGMLTPQMFFERMGNTFNSLYDDFRAALDVKINNTKIAQDYMSNLLANSKDKVKEWTGKKAEIKTIKLDSGKTIELTQAQLMSFYLLMKREQARGHIFGLGIKAAPIVAVDKKGMKYVKKQFEPVKITLDDATRMIAMLSKEQRRIADGIGKFMNTYSKQWVNEATLQNYGYELAKEENYFPIKVDRDFLKSDFDNTNLDPTFTSMGFLKATIKGAGNAIILEDVFDVFTEHADKAATYNAFVGITESTKKIVNYKTQDNSIKQAMNKKFGIQAFNYLKKFMVDLQGGIRTESGSPIVTGLIRNVKRATLGLNLRTIIQQPTAIVRASALIDIDYLIKGIAMKSDKAEMLEKSPIARWKSWGYFNLDTGRSMKDIILDSVPLLDKQYQGMQIADDITWTKIWNAVKLEIEDNEPGLKVGSAEYFDAVNYRFNEIIDRTQVVDTVMHRSDAMRQSDSSWKILTAFMSEPTKSYNLLLNAVEKYNANKSAENKKVLLRTFSAWTATMLVNTLVISMLDMWRRKEDDKETFKDKWIDNILNDVTGYVPIVRDIYSLFEGYSVKRMEYNGIERIVRAINRSKKYIEEIAEDKKHSYPLRLITKDWIESVAYVFGVGAINVSKDLEALLRNYTRWIDDEGAINDIYEFMFKK